MDLNQMIIFAKVVEHRSFTKAGKALGLEKSSISQKIAQLEERVGVRLLNRTTRSVTLTEAGQGYYHYCSQIVEKAEEAEAFAESLKADPQGTLRITTAHNGAPELLESLISPYLERYPEMKVEIAITDEIMDLVKGRFDIAFRGSIENLPDSSLIAKLVYSTPFRFFASPDFIARHGEPKTLDELQQFDIISLMNQQDFDKGFKLPIHIGRQKKELLFRGRIKTSGMDTAVKAATLGYGIALLPELIVQRLVGKGELIPLLGGLKIADGKLFALYPSRVWIPAKLRTFLQFIDDWTPDKAYN